MSLINLIQFNRNEFVFLELYLLRLILRIKHLLLLSSISLIQSAVLVTATVVTNVKVQEVLNAQKVVLRSIGQEGKTEVLEGLNNKILLLSVNLVLCLANLLSNKDSSIPLRATVFIRIAVKVALREVLDTVLKQLINRDVQNLYISSIARRDK